MLPSFSSKSCNIIAAIIVLAPTCLGSAPTSSASYSLQTTYSDSSFFDGFDFFTEADPTHGFVTYVDQTSAQQRGLINARDGSPVTIGVDSTNTYNGNASYWGINGVGRPSVRLTSKQKFNHGMFIADIAHMPGGVCGTWPALWTLGDGTWPSHGEIDIIEGVNDQKQALSSLHTSGQCNVLGSAPETGTVQSTNCAYNSNTGDNAAGCGVLSADTSSFGSNFNSIGGGVHVMEWQSAYIKTWFFRRGAIPADIISGKPNPSSWGSPYASFQGDCNIDANFANHQLVIDTTFCGDWAGAAWADSCKASTGVSSCSAFVGNNPRAFKDMYWSINFIKVYNQNGNGTNTSTTSSSSLMSTSHASTIASSVSSTLATSSSGASPSKSVGTTSASSFTSKATTTSTFSSSATTRFTTSTTTTRTTTIMTTMAQPITATSTTTKKTTTTTTRRKWWWKRGIVGEGEYEMDEFGYHPIPPQAYNRRNNREQSKM